MSIMKFMIDVGNRLKRRRKELGYTQSQLVESLNKNSSTGADDYISDKQISRVESGHNYTRLDKFVAWCLTLEKTPDYFLLGVDNGQDDKDDKDNKISKICEYLKLCEDEDIDTTLIFVKAMYEKNKK